MAWMMSVNEILRDDITKLNYTLIPPGFHGDVRAVRLMQESLSKIIDELGRQSASAQGLNKVITTAEKLRNSPSHCVYLLKDPSRNGDAGEVTGFLKVGNKKLYLFDRRDKVREVEPLCVLDFYVLRDKQRRGYGKILFDYMIQDMNVSPKHLAIDGPSPKMVTFLQRNYGITELVKQANNFAVAPEFFQDDSRAGSTPSLTPSLTPSVGRYSASRPPSTIAAVIHGGGGGPISKESGSESPVVASPEPEVAEEEVAEAAAEEPAERPSSLSLEAASSPPAAPSPAPPAPPALAPAPAAAPTPAPAAAAAEPHAAGASASRRDLQVTDQGYFDIKFYHNKLW